MYEQLVLAAVEQRGGKIGIRLPDTGEWLSLEEPKVSPKCRNTIAWDDEHGPVLWRTKLALSDFAALASIKKGNLGRIATDRPFYGRKVAVRAVVGDRRMEKLRCG